MPRHREAHDPINDPSLHDLMEGRDPADQAKERIRDILDLCDGNFRQDLGTTVPDPEDLFVLINEIRPLIKPLPSTEQSTLKRELTELTSRVAETYPDFIRFLVEQVGHRLSRGKEPSMSVETIKEYFQKARDAESLVSKYKRDDYLISLIEEQLRLDFFEKEPRYYLFEQASRRLEAELGEDIHPYFDRGFDPRRAIGDAGEAVSELQKTIDTFQREIGRLSDLAHEMVDQQVKETAKASIHRFDRLLRLMIQRKEESTSYTPDQGQVIEEGSLSWALSLMGLSSGATLQYVKARFLELAKQWHPDVVGEGYLPQMQLLTLAMRTIRESWSSKTQ